MQDFKYAAKQAFRTVLFFLILLSLFLGLSHWLTEASKRDDRLIQSRNKSIVRIQKEAPDTIDVIIVGDSLSYTAFSPMKLWKDQGISSFVCGQSGQNIQETYYMLKTALETQSPKLVIIETNVLFRSTTGLMGLKESLAEKGNYYFPIFRFHNVWKPFFLGIQYAEKSYKGYMVRETVQPYPGGKYMKKTRKKKALPGVTAEYMDEIIDLCQENGAKLLLVSSPSPLNYNYKRHNALIDYCEEHRLDYEDLNLKTDLLGIDWKTDSLDKGDHLNLMGAHKVTAYMGEYLRSHYDLPDHRGEAAYRSWENEASSYQAKMEKKMKSIKKRAKLLQKASDGSSG